jgi:glycosidase
VKRTFFLLSIFLFFCSGCEKNLSYSDPQDEFHRLRIYQVMVEAFQDGDSTRNYNVGYGPGHHRGDLKGITKALPYIKSLGMNAIWLTPIFDSGKGSGNDPKLDATGYFARDYFKIDPHFGTLEDAREMVNTAHQLGMYVFLDGVFGHHKENVVPSPKGNLPVGPPGAVNYPESLPFYSEVAFYWIDELEIDGWRLDQAYQVPVQYWKVIREAVEAKCRERKAAGKRWGTLGYMVGEIWSTAENISRGAYGTEETPGLLSAFDFPLRYRLVQALAVEEKGLGHQPASVLNAGFKSHQLYPAHAIPNLMLTNHDLVRFGDLIQRAGLGGRGNPDYWKRHQCAFSFLAAYSGPITFYYGDEIGEELPGFAAKVSDSCWVTDRCDDHVSRTNGRISGFTPEEKDLKNYLTALMKLRETHPALWKGSRKNLLAGETLYADLKEFEENRVLYLLNISTQPDNVKIYRSSLNAGQLKDALTGESFSLSGEYFSIPMEGVSARFLLLK